MKKMLLGMVLAFSAATLQATVTCDKECLQADFQNPNGQTCTDIYYKCCEAYGFKTERAQDNYNKCINNCHFDTKLDDYQYRYDKCRESCETQFKGRRLELPTLQCPAKS